VRNLYESPKPAPDFFRLQEELQRHPHLTLQLAWEEYRQAHPDGYGYSRFCELYQRWRQCLDVVLRQEHAASLQGRRRARGIHSGADLSACSRSPLNAVRR
jgi:transposase